MQYVVEFSLILLCDQFTSVLHGGDKKSLITNEHDTGMLYHLYDVL